MEAYAESCRIGYNVFKEIPPFPRFLLLFKTFFHSFLARFYTNGRTFIAATSRGYGPLIGSHSMRSGASVQIAAATLSGNSLRQTVHTHFASVHQAAKLVAALLRVARVTKGPAQSNGSLSPAL